MGQRGQRLLLTFHGYSCPPAMRTFLRRILALSLMAAVLGGYALVRSEGFAQSWRDFVVEQLERRGVYLELDFRQTRPASGRRGGEGHRGLSGGLAQDAAGLGGPALNLDLDLGKLMRREVEVQGLDLRQANLAFPIDPGGSEVGTVAACGTSAPGCCSPGTGSKSGARKASFSDCGWASPGRSCARAAEGRGGGAAGARAQAAENSPNSESGAT